ncbi:MAG: NYN domain-containing protein [Anaerolineales bacterium]|uniref:NYN domain-containing protein n=1 Tax=Candidatus Villigracilis proximus TaxID=3140683 RepID=UPI003134C027|nr:NYN domain-containing protein [Anaerolineales bacterium]MBK8823190.1 NYN domain-containing protein [Anaerolineales bacterium]MBK9207071.1 NYN domain-containing protein [Anaerolineales bacterium]
MPYLIDGHNLIPKVGLRLDSPDDEMELVAILQEFARVKRQQVEVYFDGAPIGQAGSRSLGTVRAHFVKLGQTADSAIRARLNRMEKDARNWIVVSSDREVQSSARVVHAQYISAEEFVKFLREARNSAPKANTDDKKLSSAEVDEWLKLFRDKGD